MLVVNPFGPTVSKWFRAVFISRILYRYTRWRRPNIIKGLEVMQNKQDMIGGTLSIEKRMLQNDASPECST